LIDGINWELNTRSKFKGKDDKEQILVEYCAMMYDKKIDDMEQLLLVSRPKKSQQFQGITRPLLLATKHCTWRGLGPDITRFLHYEGSVTPLCNIERLHADNLQ